MTSIIWKYPLRIDDVQTLKVPIDAIPLCVRLQYGTPNLWVRCSPGAEQTEQDIRIYGTGNPIPDDAAFTERYVDTILHEGFVWHVYWAL